MDQYTEYKESDFSSTKSDFMELMCKNLASGLIMDIGYDTAGTIMHQRIKFLKFMNDLQWKLSVIMEYSGKDIPQRSQLAKLGCR